MPTDNAKVERSQGVLGDWIEFEKCQDTFELQIQLWKQAEFHNYHFPIRRLNHKKRIEAFSSLHFTGKSWDPTDFRLQRALDFLAEGNWERKVSTNGQVTIYGHRFSVGMKYKHQSVSIKLCPKKNEWTVFDQAGDLIKTVPTAFSEQAIWGLDLS